MNFYALLAGTAIALFIIARFRVTRLERRAAPYPLLLATFPVYYWAFALFASDYAALGYELLAGAFFIGLAYSAYKLGSTSGMLVLAAAYIGHAVYDFVHESYFHNAGTPLWWPEFCGAVDGLIGVYLVYLALTMPAQPNRQVSSRD